MKSIKCLPQRSFKLMLAAVFLIGAIGFTLLPFIDFIVAIPFMALAFYFLNVKLDDRCEISFSHE